MTIDLLLLAAVVIALVSLVIAIHIPPACAKCGSVSQVEPVDLDITPGRWRCNDCGVVFDESVERRKAAP